MDLILDLLFIKPIEVVVRLLVKAGSAHAPFHLIALHLDVANWDRSRSNRRCYEKRCKERKKPAFHHYYPLE